MTDTRFAAGAHPAYVTDSVIAIAAGAEIEHAAMACCTTDDWDAIIDGVQNLAALVMHHAGQVRLAVRGAARIVVATAGGDRQFDGDDSGDGWTIDTVEGARHITLVSDRSQSHPAPTYRTDGGVVPAAVVARRLGAPATDPVDAFEVMFGHTVARSVEDAAVRPVDRDTRHQTPLGVLVFSTGQRVILDSDVVIGRNPRRVDVDAACRPHLVELTHPGVSRRHAVVHIDRWTASIEDLRSSNGTTIEPPGSASVTLIPGAPAELAIGSFVELAGEVSFSLEEAA